MSTGIRVVLYLAFFFSLCFFRSFGESFGLHHFQPYIALFFALAALQKWRWVILTVAAYLVSTILASKGFQLWMLSPLCAFALISLWGTRFSKKSGMPVMLGGSLASAGVFYLVTNTASWLTDGQYAKSFSGLGQALWTGIPGYAPTWTFFRNDAMATVLFTAIILILSRMTFFKKTELSPVAEI